MPRIIETLIEEEMRSSYIDYAMSVIVGRALPEVRDGLKPVQRRILFAMRELGLLPNRPFRKSATVVGEVIGKFHPHGDMAVYDALVRMAQEFSLRYPLIEGQGNFGSIDGDPPAAYRYTETRLARMATELLQDLDENTVDMVPNFDERLKEPLVLPARAPNLLLNGASGIAVGYATNIPPHNLRELVDGLVKLIDDPDLADEKLFSLVKGPDFPTGGTILGRQGILDAYQTGRGRIVIQSKFEIVEEEGKPDKIVVTEIPYQVSKSLIISKIAELVRSKRITGISDLRDESDREGLRITIELRRGAPEQVILNKLLKHTPLQEVYGINFLGLIRNQPQVLPLRRMLSEYLAHREEVVERRTRYRLEKTESRAHIVEGYIKAIGDIDAIIELIKASKDVKEAKSKLVQAFEFTEAQAQAILELRLQSLTKLEQSKLEDELKELKAAILEYQEILGDRTVLLSVIKKELLQLKKSYGDDRKTVIEEEEPEEFDIEDLIPREEVLVTLTHDGYIKRTPLRMYRGQKRGGTGKSGIRTYEGDFPTLVATNLTHSCLMLFSDQGRAFWVKTYAVPEGTLRAKGRPLQNIVRLREDERITAMIPFDDFKSDHAIFMVTRLGKGKKTSLRAFANAKLRGIQAINLRKGDRLIGVELTQDEDELVVAKSSGLALRFQGKDVRTMGRQAAGVKITRLKGNDTVVSLVKVGKDKRLLLITENGYGKRLIPERIRRIKRGGLGVRIQKVSEKTGKLVKVILTDQEDELIILTRKGNCIRLKAGRIKTLGRETQGVKLMRVKEGDEVVDVAVIQEPH
jgi:DNA gyrase subunit A